MFFYAITFEASSLTTLMWFFLTPLTEDCQLNNAEKRVKLLWILILVRIAISYAVNFPLCFLTEPFAMDTPLQRTCALPNEKFPSIIS